MVHPPTRMHQIVWHCVYNVDTQQLRRHIKSGEMENAFELISIPLRMKLSDCVFDQMVFPHPFKWEQKKKAIPSRKQAPAALCHGRHFSHFPSETRSRFGTHQKYDCPFSCSHSNEKLRAVCIISARSILAFEHTRGMHFSSKNKPPQAWNRRLCKMLVRIDL